MYFRRMLTLLMFILAGCGSLAAPAPAATSEPTPGPPSFAVNVTNASGSVSFTATTYTINADPDSAVRSIDFANGETGQIAQIFFEPAVAPDSLTLIASTDAMNPQRQPLNGVWVLAQTEDTSSGAEAVYYSKEPTGTFTLTSAGEVWSGTFQITLTNADGAAISVAGNFANLS